MSDNQIKKNYSVGDEVVFKLYKRSNRLFHGDIIKINKKSYRVRTIFKGNDDPWKGTWELVTIPKPFVIGMDDGWMSNK